MPRVAHTRVDESDVLNPGLLRHQVQYVRQTVTSQNSYGEDVTTATTVLTCKARVVNLMGRELWAAQQRWGEARYKLVQHYSPGLQVKDVIHWYVDGAVKTLDVLDVGDAGGNGRIQTIYAKDHV